MRAWLVMWLVASVSFLTGWLIGACVRMERRG